YIFLPSHLKFVSCSVFISLGVWFVFLFAIPKYKQTSWLYFFKHTGYWLLVTGLLDTGLSGVELVVLCSLFFTLYSLLFILCSLFLVIGFYSRRTTVDSSLTDQCAIDTNLILLFVLYFSHPASGLKTIEFNACFIP